MYTTLVTDSINANATQIKVFTTQNLQTIKTKTGWEINCDLNKSHDRRKSNAYSVFAMFSRKQDVKSSLWNLRRITVS